jgi:hypothetical protein
MNSQETGTDLWHSLRENVYHNNTHCQLGRKITEADKRLGAGGRPLCDECIRLGREDGQQDRIAE